MARVRSGRLANPESVSGVKPELLLRFLEQFRKHLEPRGVFIAAGLDEDAVARLFSDLGPDLPDDLIDQIGVIDEMARPSNFDKLLGEATRLDLDVPEDASAGDLVVLLLLDGAESLERIYAEQLLIARRKFRSHLALTDEPPQVRSIPDHNIEELRLALDLDFVHRRRGGGVRVYPVMTDDGFRMLIRRGDVLHREAVVDPVTASTRHIAFRPQRFDALIYTCGDGELLVNAKTDADARAYLGYVGEHIFGNTALFLSEGLPARYSLTPIIVQGTRCLDCGDVPELARVRLIALEWRHPGSKMKRRLGPFDDVFRGMSDEGDTFPAGAVLLSATFRLMYRDGRETTRRVVPPNDIVGEDCEVFQRWLALRGFLRDRGVATRGLTRVLLATG